MWKLRQNDDVDVDVVVAFKTKLPCQEQKSRWEKIIPDDWM